MEKEHLIVRIYRHTLAKWFFFRNRVSFLNENNIDLSNGPVLLLSNHVGTYDPIEISGMIPCRPIHWVAGAHLFRRNKLLAWVFNKVAQAIPKQQGMSDVTTLMMMRRMFKEGKMIGLFPEGTRTWDGDSLNINYEGLAKLILRFKPTVAFVSIEGGFAREPRWAVKRRRGPVFIHLKSTITPQEMENQGPEELAVDLKNKLEFSNDEWKKTHPYSYLSPVRAEGIEQVLYMCPKCKKISSLTAEKNKIYCNSCGANGVLNENDDLEGFGDDFSTIHKWHTWEIEEIKGIDNIEKEPGVLFEKANPNDNSFTEIISGNIMVSLKNNVFSVENCNDNNVYEFDFNDISSFILNTKSTIEFISSGLLYRVRLLPKASALKYFDKYNVLADTKETL